MEANVVGKKKGENIKKLTDMLVNYIVKVVLMFLFKCEFISAVPQVGK